MNHAEATPIVREAWVKVHKREPSTLETLYTQAIASLETGYGRIGQFGNLAAQGKYNWGGLQKPVSTDGTCPEGFALGQDQGKVCFFVFPTDADAAAHMIKQLTQSKLRPNMIEAMAGSAEDVATAMRGTDLGKDPSLNHTAWYEGIRGTTEAERIAYYATAIRNSAKSIGTALEAKGRQLLAEVPPSNAGVGLIALGVLGSVIYMGRKMKWTL